MAYATLADLAAYTGVESTGPGDERLLQRATDLIDSALMAAYYMVDTTGTATDAGVVAALKNACCAQVEWWRATNDDLGAQGQYTPAPGRSVQQVVRVVAGSGLRRLAPRAREHLSNVNAVNASAGIWRHKPLVW
jgi:hypothetical protein